MQATHLIQVIIVLVLSIQSTIKLDTFSTRTSASFTQPIAVAVSTTEDASPDAEINDGSNWLIVDEKSRWTADEAIILQRVLKNTLNTLEFHGINGMALLDGYRFRRQSGNYVGDVAGRMGIIDHNIGEITLSDKAFTVQNGFAIYHELGHAVDYQLNRQLSAGFHKYAGGPEISEDSNQWQTANNYWLRLQGRNDREEAAADAFAVLVMSQAGLGRPIFANQPVTTDYNGISAAAGLALRTIE